MIGQRMEAVYDRVANEYAAWHSAMPERIAEPGMRFLGYLAPCSRALDAGCGPSYHMAWIEAQGFRVTGIDISTGMLAQARMRTHGELLQIDMRQLIFPAASFEGVWCCASFLQIPKAQSLEALRQIRRVLAPRGMLFLPTLGGEGER